MVCWIKNSVEIPKYHSQSKMLWNHLIFNMLGMFYLWARHVFCWGKEILYSSVISQVPFFTHFFPWLCLSLIIQKKCTPIECKHCCILLHFFFHQDATNSSISVSGRTHIYTPLFYETLRMLPWPFFCSIVFFCPYRKPDVYNCCGFQLHLSANPVPERNAGRTFQLWRAQRIWWSQRHCHTDQILSIFFKKQRAQVKTYESSINLVAQICQVLSYFCYSKSQKTVLVSSRAEGGPCSINTVSPNSETT